MINLSNIDNFFPDLFLGTLGIELGAAGSGSKDANHFAMVLGWYFIILVLLHANQTATGYSWDLRCHLQVNGFLSLINIKDHQPRFLQSQEVEQGFNSLLCL